MGMFDYVRVEHPIDGVSNPAIVEWQTKDFDAPWMDTYRITADGRLFEELTHVEDRSDKTAALGTFASIIGCMTPVHDGWRDMNYHGDLEFCGHIGNEWPCFIARFTNGQLQRITRRAESASTPTGATP